MHLRKVTVTRLTLLNARRGSEPARMLLADFNERHSWISKGMSKELTAKYAITFIMGKGNTLVPVSLPRDCEKAMRMLADGANRAHAGISPKNDFLFAYTQQSVDSSTGYNEIMDICRIINIPVITAKILILTWDYLLTNSFFFFRLYYYFKPAIILCIFVLSLHFLLSRLRLRAC